MSVRRAALPTQLHPVDATEEEWQLRRPRRISGEDRRRFESNLAELFRAVGMPLGSPGTRRTPARFLDALIEATEGYEGDPDAVTLFPDERRDPESGASDQVVEGPIRFFALCEHHALPFHGTAWVGYVPSEQIIGISKLTRLVRMFSRRFTVQERIGDEIAAALTRIAVPQGVAVSLSAIHTCTQMRGVRENDAMTHTLTWRGTYESEAPLRAEFLALTGQERA